MATYIYSQALILSPTRELAKQIHDVLGQILLLLNESNETDQKLSTQLFIGGSIGVAQDVCFPLPLSHALY
jgi:superfamily II DNA/RNA helicase